MNQKLPPFSRRAILAAGPGLGFGSSLVLRTLRDEPPPPAPTTKTIRPSIDTTSGSPLKSR